MGIREYMTSANMLLLQLHEKKKDEDVSKEELRKLSKIMKKKQGVWYDIHKHSWEARRIGGKTPARKYYSVYKNGFHSARSLAIETNRTKQTTCLYRFSIKTLPFLKKNNWSKKNSQNVMTTTYQKILDKPRNEISKTEQNEYVNRHSGNGSGNGNNSKIKNRINNGVSITNDYNNEECYSCSCSEGENVSEEHDSDKSDTDRYNDYYTYNSKHNNNYNFSNQRNKLTVNKKYEKGKDGTFMENSITFKKGKNILN